MTWIEGDLLFLSLWSSHNHRIFSPILLYSLLWSNTRHFPLEWRAVCNYECRYDTSTHPMLWQQHIYVTASLYFPGVCLSRVFWVLYITFSIDVFGYLFNFSWYAVVRGSCSLVMLSYSLYRKYLSSMSKLIPTLMHIAKLNIFVWITMSSHTEANWTLDVLRQLGRFTCITACLTKQWF